MVIIAKEPWPEKNYSSSKQPEKDEKKDRQKLFKFQDLASDYYQVLRQRNRPAVCRVLWGIVVTALFCLTVLVVYNLLQSYFRYESYNQISTNWKDNLTLPAITICSTNFIDYKKMKKTMEEDGETEALRQFEEVMDLLERFDGRTNILDVIDTVNLDSLTRYEREKGSLIAKFALDVASLIIGTPHYFFGEVGRNISDPKNMIIATQLGLCLDINNDGKLQQSVGGSKGGFRIDLNTNLQNYLPTTSSHGFILFIREQNEVLMLNQGGYVISPGSETFVKLTAKSVTRLGPPHGTCENIKSRYSKSERHLETIRECWQRQAVQRMVRECGCIPQFFAATMWFSGNKTDILDEALADIDSETSEGQLHPLFKHSSTVDNVSTSNITKRSEVEVTERSEVKVTDAEFLGYITSPYFKRSCGIVQQPACEILIHDLATTPENQLAHCPEPCKYHEWEAVLASIPFPPTQQYFQKFLKNDKVRSFEEARESTARLHVYYDEIRVSKEDQIPAYEAQSLISEFGGAVDLFIGFSVFTVVQLVEISIAFCYSKFSNRAD